MPDEQPDPTTAPEATPEAAPEPAPAPVQDAPAPAPEGQDAPSGSEPENAPAVTPDPPDASTPSTSSEPSDQPSGEQPAAPAAQPVVVDLATKRTDDDPILGSWVDVVSGEYQGRFAAYVATVSHDTETGYPEQVIVRTRDADNLLLEVAYSDLRPSARNGGR